MAFTFTAQVAWDPIGKQAVKNVSFQVYATSDTGFVTPLPITDPYGVALPGNILNSGTMGVFPQFMQASNPAVVITDPAHTYVWTFNCVPTDAATAAFANDKTSSTSAAIRSLSSGVWQSSTAYTVGQAVINPTGDLVRCTTAHTSTTAYDSTKFALNATDSSSATSAALNAAYAPINGSANYAPASGSVNYESGITTVLYVAGGGSDANSGKTWAKAKATISGALTTLAGAAGIIEVGAGTINEPALWGTIPAGTVIRGRGKGTTTITKSILGDLATLSDSVRFADIAIDGQGATYTGRGFVLAGTAGNQILDNLTLRNFDGYCLDFAVGAGSGFKATNLEAYRTAAGTGTNRYAIHIDPTQQLSAVPRSFIALTTAGQCSIDFGGCNDTLVANSFLSDLNFTPNSRGVNIVTTRVSNQAALTVDGHNNSIVACDINPQITLAANCDANTIGPGSFNNLPIIDNSGNERNRITAYGGTPNSTPAMSGEYISGLAVSVTNVTVGNGVLYLVPVTVSRIMSLSNLAVNVTTAGSVGSVARLGIYRDNNDVPGSLLIDAGTVATTATGMATIAVSQRLYPGRYWFAFAQQGAPTTAATLTAIAIASGAVPASNPAAINSGRYTSGITAGLPATVTPVVADGLNMVRVMGLVV